MKSPAQFIAIALLSACALHVNAQPRNVLAPPPQNIKMDGSLNEWADSLRYFNEEKKLYYTLANDQENLYMAMRLNDRSEQMRVMAAGITLGINTKGKKKADYSLTFPVGGMVGPRLNFNGDAQVSQQDRDELLRERLTRLRDIKVSGFKSIESETITTTNTYGIRVGINYDENGYLVYEASIPLKLFDTFDANKKAWAFNFKINGMPKPGSNRTESLRQGGPGSGMGGGMGGRGGRGGMGGGGMRGGRGGMGSGMPGGQQGGTDRAEMFKSIDFWEVFYLSGTGK